MKKLIVCIYIVVYLGISTLMCTAYADNIYTFNKPAQQAQFEALLMQLRCLVCQNQNLADSYAPLAKDLRTKIYHMVQADKSDKEIIDYLVARYGDFILYKPVVKSTTLLLWFGPYIIMFLSLISLFYWVYKHSKMHTTLHYTSVQNMTSDALGKSQKRGGY